MAQHKTDEELEAIVRSFLARIGLEHQVRPDLMTVVVKLKHIDPRFNYSRVPDRLMPDVEARWYSDEMILEMRESVFVGMQRGDPRARMSVSHELGHYLHRHRGTLNRSTKKTAVEISVPLIRFQESEARRTGPIILAPEHLVPENASVDEIAFRFGLSREAAQYRKEEIEAIRRRRKGEARPLPKSIVDYLHEAKRRGLDIRTRLDD